MPPHNLSYQEYKTMSKSLSQAAEQVHVAEIVYHGDQLLIPNGMSVDQAIDMQDQITLLAEQSKKKVVEPTFNEVIGGAVTAQLAPVISQIEEMQRVSLRLGKLIP